MANKGGRKSLRDEVRQANVINLSWATLERAFKSKVVPDKEKRAMALEICKKTCPTKIDLGENATNTLAELFARR